MSDARKLVLPSAERGPTSLPAWLAQRGQRIERAPFDPRPPLVDSDSELAAHDDAEDARAAQHVPRRSSLPPRKSVPPPPVVISRLPPPPADLAQHTASPGLNEQRFAEAALELGSLRARVLGSVEEQLLRLAVGIAEAVIEREVSLHPELLARLARTAIASLGEASQSRLRASKDAYQTLATLYGEPAVDVDGVRVELVLDHSLEGLGLVAETASSRVDGRIAERLRGVLSALEAEHRRSGAEEDQ